jgi:cytidyltransferase-like protein
MDEIMKRPSKTFMARTMVRLNGQQECIATIGGTFDTLHKGHGEYIQLAFNLANYVIIYLNSDENIRGKKQYCTRTYEQRLKNLTDFIQCLGYTNRCEIRQLNNFFEEVKNAYLREFNLESKTYVAVVSPEYLDFFLEVNSIRENLGMKSIFIVLQPKLIVVQPKLRIEKIELSSSAIRNGLIENADFYTVNLANSLNTI